MSVIHGLIHDRPAPTPEQQHQQAQESASDWRRLADAQDAMATWEESIGYPYGDVSTYHYNASLYRRVADELEAQYR